MYKGVVLHGNKEGRTIGFPTLNFDSAIVPQNTPQGVYSSDVVYQDKKYLGALYFGPRLVKNESHIVLEIHVLNFDKEIYGKTVSFTIGKSIRGVMSFRSFNEMMKQIKKDVADIQKMSTLVNEK